MVVTLVMRGRGWQEAAAGWELALMSDLVQAR
jgi:hypothetical protein